ncbi:MAG: chemotaxis protein CheW [Thermodesulfovibrionales bacterium]
MDIAKIRKKLKDSEAESQQSKAHGQSAKVPEDQTVTHNETIIEPSFRHVSTSNTEQQPPDIEDRKTVDTKKEPKSSDNAQLQAREDQKKILSVKENIEAEKEEEIIEILTFSLLKEEFAFRVSQLAEILRSQWITRVPNVPDYVLGITSLRGKIIPVIDLKLRLSLTSGSSDIIRKGKILIINGAKGPVGTAVDKVIGVARVAKSDILPPPSHLSEKELKFIDGIAVVDKRFVSVINMEEAIALHLQ